MRWFHLIYFQTMFFPPFLRIAIKWWNKFNARRGSQNFPLWCVMYCIYAIYQIPMCSNLFHFSILYKNTALFIRCTNWWGFYLLCYTYTLPTTVPFNFVGCILHPGELVYISFPLHHPSANFLKETSPLAKADKILVGTKNK